MALTIPHFLLPPLMSNLGSYIVSLSNLCKWLASQAESLGVEIYPGFPAHELIVEGDVVKGVVTGDLGVAKDGRHKDGYTPGMELRGKYTFFAEGARGSLSKQLCALFRLQDGREPQKFGIGLKELWELPPGQHKKGLALHGMGWPLDTETGGGLFMYHWGENLCSIGLVVHLNYKNPWLDPFGEFQRAKTHPAIASVLKGVENGDAYTPSWSVTKGEGIVSVDADGTIHALAPGDAVVEAKIPGLAARSGFLFIKALGQVGFYTDGAINWDIAILVAAFGASLFVSQILSGMGMPANPQQSTANKITPVMITGMFLFFPLPAGVLLYMVVANIFQAGQTYLLGKEALPDNLQAILDQSASQQTVTASASTGERLPFEPKGGKK